MHPADDELRALIDGQLDERKSDRVLVHLESCDACRARKEALDLQSTETAALLQALDRPAPEPAVDEVVREAKGRTLPRREGSHRALLAASVAALLVAGGVLAAIVPGSPVREIVERIVGGPEPQPSSGTGVADAWERETGVAWVPGGGVEIVFEAEQTEGTIELVWSGGDTARVDVRSDSVGFRVGDDSVLVQNRGSRASYRVAVPEAVSDLRIRVGSRTVYVRTGGRILQDEFGQDGRIPLSETR